MATSDQRKKGKCEELAISLDRRSCQPWDLL